MNKKQIVSLGEKGVFWELKIILLAPFWFVRPQEDRKTWEEFKNGLIDHKCKYDLDKPILDNDSGYCHFECLHTGCNIISMDRSNCTDCGKEIVAVKRDKNLKPIPEMCISCKYST